MESQRIDIRVPKALLEKVSEYQKDQGIANRTTALLELVRKGLATENK